MVRAALPWTPGRGRFDIVGWDRPQRRGPLLPRRRRAGQLLAGPARAPTPADERRYLAKTDALAQRCGARNGALLAHISTTDTVRDLDHLRRLVGDRRLTFLARSGGTLIGLTYANLFPRRVRAMVLDGVVDPVALLAGTDLWLAGASPTRTRVRRVPAAVRAAGPSRCALAGNGPPPSSAGELLARLPGRDARRSAHRGGGGDRDQGPRTWRRRPRGRSSPAT